MNRLSTLAFSSVLLLALSGCERPKAAGMEKPPEGPVPVTVTEVKSGNFPAVLEATGQTQAFYTVQVFARVNGYLQKRAYTEGQFVNKGDTLFIIDPSDLKNSLESAKAAYELALANHTNAQAVLNRIKPLAQANAASQQDLDNATASERNSAAALMGAKASLEQAKLNLSYTTVKAPISGFVDKSKIDIGTYVTAGANGLLTTVYQNDPIYVNFTFSENQRIARQNAIASGNADEERGDQFYRPLYRFDDRDDHLSRHYRQPRPQTPSGTIRPCQRQRDGVERCTVYSAKNASHRGQREIRLRNRG
jgi:membrane fusion protein (multidrug efflux system)